MFGLGGTEILLILLAVLILFGASKIPEFAKGLGKGIREFKDAAHDVRRDIESPAPTADVQPPPTSSTGSLPAGPVT